MRRHVLATVLLLAGGLVAQGWADDAAMSGIGGTVKPMKSHPSIVMESERVVVRLTREKAKVDCTFVFRNTGKATEVTMGFPESGWGGDSEPDSFEEFQAWVDGKPVAVKRVTGRDVEDGYQLWWTKTVAFDAGQTRTVRNIYRSGLGASVVAFAGGLESHFEYVLSTGASWKGKIGSVEVTVELIGLAVEDVNFTPKRYTRGPRQVTWRWQNLEPTEKHDIGISFGQGGDALLYVDGVGPGDEGYEGYGWGPRLEGKRVFALAENVAAWVGASLSWDARAKTATLSYLGRRVTVTVGKRTASTNEGAFPLGGTPRLAGEGHLEIPVQAVAEAFGAAVRFDPLTERTYLHTPKELTTTRRPDWLYRQLTEKELKGKSAEQLQARRNEIYARRGREFENREIRHRFYCQSWYTPNPKYSDALLTEVDQANLALIRKAEKQSEASP